MKELLFISILLFTTSSHSFAFDRAEAQRAKELQELKEVYISSIVSKVRANWYSASKVSPLAKCVFNISQSLDGNVRGVSVENCNSYSSEHFKKSVMEAVLRAQPIPKPPVPELFERNIKFVFGL